jgi:hypothetical protein
MNTHMAATETLNQNNSQPLTCWHSHTQPYSTVWMLLLNQIMVSLIWEELVWEYMLSICRSNHQILSISGLLHKGHIVT